jgi:hypothetical protein
VATNPVAPRPIGWRRVGFEVLLVAGVAALAYFGLGQLFRVGQFFRTQKEPRPLSDADRSRPIER